jgi:hypothetical protein
MFVVDKVVEEDRQPEMLLANGFEPITLPDGTTQSLGPAAHDRGHVSSGQWREPAVPAA